MSGSVYYSSRYHFGWGGRREQNKEELGGIPTALGRINISFVQSKKSRQARQLTRS